MTAVERADAGWDGYVAAMAELDAIRRGAIAAVGEQERAAQEYRSELAHVQARIALQRTRLAEAARRARRPVPTVEPGALEHDAARVLVPASAGADVIAAIGAAVADAQTCLDVADATLVTASDRPLGRGPLARWPAPLRHALPYAWYALLATLVVVLVGIVFYAPIDWWIRLAFTLGAPTVGFLLAVASVALMYPGEAAARSRATRLGLVICAVPLLVGLVLTAAG